MYDFLRPNFVLAVVSDDCGSVLSLPFSGAPLAATSSQEPAGFKVFATEKVATFTLLVDATPRDLSKLQMLLDFNFFWSMEICKLVLEIG